jgi:4-methylaminobutanoate oxidase (formaldehyde-forming)
MPNLPTHAQVVIIGGGVGGCSIAYHLTLMGWKDVVVLERHELTSGSTWHSAGLVGQMRSDANLTRMMHYSTDLYRRLTDRTHHGARWAACGWHPRRNAWKT